MKIRILILLLALIFRGFDFGATPAGISDDEASHGYNAYSLLLTGKDEYGKSWPILNRSFGTYSSNLYTYLTIVPVKLFGLNAVSVRFVSLISGLILVAVVIYTLGPAAGFVVAISPVFVFYSRAAFEANLGLMLLFLGIVLAVRKHPYLSTIILSLSAYAYQVEKILAPILILFFAAYYRKFKSLIFLVILIPLVAVSFTSGANSRASTLVNKGNYLYLFIQYFSPNNLFSRPDPEPKKSFPEVSVFYWWMITPFIIGLRKINKLILISAVVPPVIAAFTPDYFSTWRALPTFLPLAWIISKGIPNKKWVYIFLAIFAAVELYSNLVLLKHEKSVAWGYHYQTLAGFVKTTSDKPIVIDNARSNAIYIWLALYNRIPPQKFQTQDSQWLKDYYNHVEFSLDKKIDNIEIRPIFWEKDTLVDQILISDSLGISESQAKEHFLSLVTTIPDVNDQPVLYVYQTHPELKINSMPNQPQLR